jgi:hypothetical protein
MSTFETDYKKGIDAENRVLAALQQEERIKKDNPQKVTDPCSKYDFKGDRYVYELKTRNNKADKYPTTMIAADKLTENLRLLFLFTDGLYYIRYTQKRFESFERRPFQRRARVDRYDIMKEYIYIPITELKKLAVDI